MSDQILNEIWKEHLPYEIDQLRGSFGQLKDKERDDRDDSDVALRVVRNALIESFCVHARSLIDFFANRRIKKTDVTAEDFGHFPASLQTEKEPLKTLRMKINKQIFHLTCNRTIFETAKFDLQTDGVHILQLIEKEIERFNQLRPLDCKIPPLQAPSFRPPSNTTKSIGKV